MNKIYIYADETLSKIDTLNHRRQGYGLFMTRTEITKEMIEQAMQNLSINSKTRTTTGYFHASDLLDYEKQIFIEFINRHIHGSFVACFGNPTKENKSEKKRIFTSLLRNVLGLSFTLNCDQIELYVENMQGIDKKLIEKIIKELENWMLLRVCKTPIMKASFNNIEVHAGCDKETPGIQITDFLLWIAKEQIVNNNSGWINKLNKVSITTIGQIDEFEGIQFDINSFFHFNSAYKFNQAKCINLITNEALINKLDQSKYIDLYWHIEKYIVDEIIKQNLPLKIKHLQREISHLNNLVQYAANPKNNGSSIEIIFLVCKIFIYIFDTLPIYDEETYRDDCEYYINLLILKKFAGLVLSWHHLQNSAQELIIRISCAKQLTDLAKKRTLLVMIA